MLNWQDPFKLAFEMALSIIGWGLVFIVGAFGVVLAYAIGKAVVSVFTKKSKNKKRPVDAVYDKAMKDLQKAKNFRVVKDQE